MILKKIATQSNTVDAYVASVPEAARPRFDELRQLVKRLFPEGREVVSYGILGYKIGEKRAKVFVSGWKDHVALYPVPKDKSLQADIVKYQRGKGTLWFPLDEALPIAFLEKVVTALTKNS